MTACRIQNVKQLIASASPTAFMEWPSNRAVTSPADTECRSIPCMNCRYIPRPRPSTPPRRQPRLVQFGDGRDAERHQPYQRLAIPAPIRSRIYASNGVLFSIWLQDRRRCSSKTGSVCLALNLDAPCARPKSFAFEVFSLIGIVQRPDLRFIRRASTLRRVSIKSQLVAVKTPRGLYARPST